MIIYLIYKRNIDEKLSNPIFIMKQASWASLSPQGPGHLELAGSAFKRAALAGYWCPCSCRPE